MDTVSELKVLDKGFVRLEAFAGGDQSVIRSARVSYGKSVDPDEERDRKLINYLLEHDHGTPFEQNMFTLHIKAPILVFRQWHRTRIGVSYNELSARYTEMPDEFYVPEKWRTQESGPKANKQGSVEADLQDDALSKVLVKSCEYAYENYKWFISQGVAREMARMILPVNLYSAMYFTCNARSLMAFIRLRSDSHAQYETRQYSHAMAFLFREAMPLTFNAMIVEMQKDERVVGEGRAKRDYSELYKFLNAWK